MMSRPRIAILVAYLTCVALMLVFRPYETPGGLLGPGLAYTCAPRLESADGYGYSFAPEVLVLQMASLTLLLVNVWHVAGVARLRIVDAWFSIVSLVSVGMSILFWFDAWKIWGPIVLVPFMMNRYFAVADCAVFSLALSVPLVVRSVWRTRLFG